MKSIKFIIVLIVVTSNLYSQTSPVVLPGTGVANGAGGHKKPEGWNPIGSFAALKGVKLSIDLDKFQQAFPVAMNFCRQNPEVLFPPIPEAIKGKIIFKDSNSKDLTIEDICKQKKILDVYVPLVFSFYSLSKNPVFEFLLNSSLKVTAQPVVVKLNKNRKIIAARGNSIEEESWFDEKDGSIGWGPSIQVGTLIESFFKRSSSALFLHELAHVWTYRILGGYQDVPYWHDVRVDMEEYSKNGPIAVRSKSNFYEFETGEYQAFIESISNLAELSLSLIHPMVNEDGIQSFFKAHEKSADELLQTFGGGRFEKSRAQLEANEAFVTSVLARFIGTYEARVGEKYIMSVPDNQKIVAVMKALEVSRSTSLVDLMKVYDQQNQTDEGWKLLREYLTYDYKSERNIASDFTVRRKNPVFYPRGSVYDSSIVIETNEKVPSETLHSPLNKAARSRAYEMLRQKNAETYSREALLNLVTNLSQKIEGERIAFQKLDAGLQSRVEAVSSIIQDYQTAFANHERAALKIVEGIYTFIEQKKGESISEMTIEETLNRFSNPAKLIADYKQEIEARYLEITSLRSLLENNQNLSVTDGQHLMDVEAYQRLKEQRLATDVGLNVLEALESMKK
ncbi:MAG: hypothetical protein J0L93_07185 [Deltaproteobacteria bacterium]|nr:hypothetical protein [Deltaproteobacteria bacterium]